MTPPEACPKCQVLWDPGRPSCWNCGHAPGAAENSAPASKRQRPGQRGHAGPAENSAPAGGRADPLPGEQRTELGYARRLITVYGGQLRYVPAWRRWLTWDGTRWAPDTTGQAARWMKSIARRVTADALAEPDADTRRALLREARRAETAHAIAGALTLAGTEPEMAVSPDQLDADPYLLNVANGTVDLRTMTLRGHDPADLITKAARAAWHADAAHAEWDAFLGRVQPDPEMRAFLGRVTGLSLDGHVSKHVLPVHYGDGSNGKGTFFEAVMFALGDYAAPADPDLLIARTFGSHPTGVADLCGLRLVVAHETDKGSALAEATVKRLTGGDRLKARRMREDFWWFTPSHTFAMLTNHKPVITGTDHAIWRRLRLVPWEVQIPDAEQDGDLGERLQLAADAVLRFLADGYAGWREHGLAEPAKVTAATGQWRAESDALGRFIADRCLTGPHFCVRSAQLFAAWCEWARTENTEPGTQTAFSLALERLGYARRKSGVIFWDGIALAAADDEPGGLGGLGGSIGSRPTRAEGEPVNPPNPPTAPGARRRRGA